jgi:hypothetical protein
MVRRLLAPFRVDDSLLRAAHAPRRFGRDDTLSERRVPTSPSTEPGRDRGSRPDRGT